MSMANDGKHIAYISRETRCSTHQAGPGVPCWAIVGGRVGNFVVGVCGARIRKAGFNGKISAASMRKTSGARSVGAKRS